MELRVTQDDISPILRNLLAKVADPTLILRAAASQIVSITQRSFRETSLRQKSWAAKADGSPSNLTFRRTLNASIRITSLSRTGVSVGTDRKYGAIHQLGGTIRPKSGSFLRFRIGNRFVQVKSVKMPARPYLPFDVSGRLMAKAVPKVEAVITKVIEKSFKP